MTTPTIDSVITNASGTLQIPDYGALLGRIATALESISVNIGVIANKQVESSNILSVMAGSLSAFTSYTETISIKQGLIATSTGTIADKQTLIATSTGTIADKQTLIATSTGTIADKQTLIATSMGTIALKQTTIADKQSTVSDNLSSLTTLANSSGIRIISPFDWTFGGSTVTDNNNNIDHKIRLLEETVNRLPRFL